MELSPAVPGKTSPPPSPNSRYPPQSWRVSTVSFFLRWGDSLPLRNPFPRPLLPCRLRGKSRGRGEKMGEGGSYQEMPSSTTLSRSSLHRRRLSSGSPWMPWRRPSRIEVLSFLILPIRLDRLDSVWVVRDCSEGTSRRISEPGNVPLPGANCVCIAPVTSSGKTPFSSHQGRGLFLVSFYK